MLLHHDISGHGPAVVLLHSGVADSGMWLGTREVLADSFTVITPDLRGYGQTPLPGERYSDAADVLALLEHLGVQRFSLVGSSYGGHVALQVASAAADRVERLVLLCSAADGVVHTDDLREFAREEDALLEAGDVEAATALNVRTWLGPDADGATRARVHAMQAHAFTVQLAADEGLDSFELDVDLSSITAPATVVCGTHDLEFFRLVAQHLSEQLPDARLVELDWAGHLPALERPTDTVQLIRDALHTPG
ncbi:MAG TPA: alpha/beta hydrolase [Nocardioidaceae bacterium]|nr:alpha/beta hydrolase [Actinomycetota bacterium]HEV8055940.1 alpha/beta hydrolase [Nocardioidaceae bacterium]